MNSVMAHVCNFTFLLWCKICRACTLAVVWDFISFWQFDNFFDNHASVKPVMSI